MKILFNNIYFEDTPKNAQFLNCLALSEQLPNFSFRIFNTSKQEFPFIKSIYIKKGVLGKIQQLSYLIFGEEKVIVYYYDGIVDKIFVRLKNIFKKKLIVTLEADKPDKVVIAQLPEYYKFEKRLVNSIKWADFVVPISENIKETFSKELKNKKNGIAHVGFTKFVKSNPGTVRNLITYVGTLQERKQPHLFVELSEKYPSEQFLLVGKGTGEYAAKVMEKMRNKKKNNLIWKWDLSHEEINNYLLKSKIFLFPSLYEGTPKVLYEAAGAGVPCITLNKINSPVVIDEVTGFVCENNDNFAEKFDLLLNDMKLQEKFSNAIFKLAEKYTWENVSKEWGEIFVEVINEIN